MSAFVNTVLQRIVFDYQGTAEKRMKDVFKAGNSKLSPENSWYLQLAFTAPEHQGKGAILHGHVLYFSVNDSKFGQAYFHF